MDVPGDRLEAEILDAQRRMCRVLELDRSALWQTRVGRPGGLFVTHVYDAVHDGPDRDRVTAAWPGRRAAFLLSAEPWSARTPTRRRCFRGSPSGSSPAKR